MRILNKEKKKIIQDDIGSLKDTSPPSFTIHTASLELGTDQLGVGLSAETLGALDGGTDGTVDDQLGKNADRS